MTVGLVNENDEPVIKIKLDLGKEERPVNAVIDTESKVRSEIKTHKDLDVWKKSIEVGTAIYKITKTFPEEEKFGLVSQIRRSAVSVPSNIAEGAARNSKTEFKHFGVIFIIWVEATLLWEISLEIWVFMS